MNQPALRHTEVPGPLSLQGARRRMAWWDWNATGQPHPSHVVVCVHGLSRQGRDFDVLAQALSTRSRVVCVDVAGRGRSDWLADPMAYQVPTYVADMAVLLAQLRQEHATAHGPDAELHIDWVGTSMGGLIGLGLAGQPGAGIRRLVLNDVGPTIQWEALQRIGTYLGRPLVFRSEQEAAAALLAVSQGFGPHSPDQWQALTRPMLRPVVGGWGLHYDPAIAVPFQALVNTPPDTARQAAQAGEAVLWGLYDAVQAETLLLRGQDSDLLSADTARAMTHRGPKAHLVEWAGVGHAPTLVTDEQVAVVRDFVWAP